MTHEKILEYCLTKKGAYEDCPFGDGTVCVKVKKRIFAQLFHLKGVPMLTFNGDAMTGDFYRTPIRSREGITVPLCSSPISTRFGWTGTFPTKKFCA